jgi:hypothetical protein
MENFALFSVAPPWQSTGRGSALLRHHHNQPPAGQPAYLEASSIGSRNLYHRHDYQLGHRFTVPDGTALWPMWRPPRPLATGGQPR